MGHSAFAGDLSLPEGWPEKGTLRGKTVDLREAMETMTRNELALIIVDDVPGVGRCQPWKQSDFFITPDGRILL